MISSRRRDAYSVAGRYLVNDEQIRKKKKKDKSELTEENDECISFSV